MILKKCNSCNKVTEHIITSLVQGGQIYTRETCTACGNKVDKNKNNIHYGNDGKH